MSALSHELDCISFIFWTMQYKIEQRISSYLSSKLPFVLVGTAIIPSLLQGLGYGHADKLIRMTINSSSELAQEVDIYISIQAC